jgi:hypothetical protein
MDSASLVRSVGKVALERLVVTALTAEAEIR